MQDNFRRFVPLAASAALALAFAAHVYFHLGDYTAERGVAALGKTALMALAFGAMAYLVIETIVAMCGSLFEGLTAPLDQREQEKPASDDARGRDRVR
jgi:predicted PurR-regulated permease PerM